MKRASRKPLPGSRIQHPGSPLEALARRRLVSLINAEPNVLEVLDRHGVHFCAGCYLTLSSPLDRVAAYHAVPDLKRFLKDLEKALHPHPPLSRKRERD